jgi:pentapeptide MXKDX repeat protein
VWPQRCGRIHTSLEEMPLIKLMKAVLACCLALALGSAVAAEDPMKKDKMMKKNDMKKDKMKKDTMKKDKMMKKDDMMK